MNCSKCNNTGWIIYTDEYGYETAKQCDCVKQRQSLARLERSGLSGLLEKYTFDRYEADYGFQKELLSKAKNYLNEKDKWFLVVGQSGCVDCDTEYFNGKGWKRIADYNGEKVLQYNPNNKQASLIKPFRFIKEKEKEFYRVRNYRGSIDMCLSLDHNVAYVTSKGNMKKKPLSEVIKLHNTNKQGFNGRIETAFNYVDGKGIGLTDNEIRLMVAVMADGYFRKDIRQCRINIKKERKKERLRELLKDRWHKEYKKKDGFSTFMFYAPRVEKEYSDYWYDCSYEQLQIIKDEVFYWDGSIDGKGRKSYFSTSKASADFIQFVMSATGDRATICIDNRVNGIHKKPCYSVVKSKRNSLVSLVNDNAEIKAKFERVDCKDGYKYCFTVETGYLVLRRNGRIFITGNCGKSHICTAICGELLKKHEVRFMSWLTESVKLKQHINNAEVYEPLMEDYKNCEVLYIDDFFKNEQLSPADLKLANEIINFRCVANKQTIISSERLVKDLIAIDEAIIGRIVEMAEEYLTQIVGKEKNYRLRQYL